MIGLGVGIDYALFIVTRFRENYLAGGDVQEAIIGAMDTAGRAVLFAGATVIIALLGQFALGVDFLYGLAIASALAVLMTMLAALTVLPALLSRFGERIGRDPAAGEGPRRAPAQAQNGPGSGSRWSGFIERHPWQGAIAGARDHADALPRRRSRCGSATATRATTRRTRPRARPMIFSPRASAPASTARCRSSRAFPSADDTAALASVAERAARRRATSRRSPAAAEPERA